MDPESTESQRYSSLLIPNYLIPENSDANSIYFKRSNNDSLLADIIEIVHKNTSLSSEITQLKN
jgi:hypothetical protein